MASGLSEICSWWLFLIQNQIANSWLFLQHRQDKFGVRSIRNNNEELTAAVYLQVSIVSQALIFVTRSRSWSYVERPGLLLVFAFLIAQLVSVIGDSSFWFPIWFPYKGIINDPSNDLFFLMNQWRWLPLLPCMEIGALQGYTELGGGGLALFGFTASYFTSLWIFLNSSSDMCWVAKPGIICSIIR